MIGEKRFLEAAKSSENRFVGRPKVRDYLRTSAAQVRRIRMTPPGAPQADNIKRT